MTVAQYTELLQTGTCFLYKVAYKTVHQKHLFVGIHSASGHHLVKAFSTKDLTYRINQLLRSDNYQCGKQAEHQLELRQLAIEQVNK